MFNQQSIHVLSIVFQVLIGHDLIETEQLELYNIFATMLTDLSESNQQPLANPTLSKVLATLGISCTHSSDQSFNDG